LQVIDIGKNIRRVCGPDAVDALRIPVIFPLRIPYEQRGELSIRSTRAAELDSVTLVLAIRDDDLVALWEAYEKRKTERAMLGETK
jgi:hypothetical protein